MDCDKKIANLSRAVLVVKPIFIHSFIQSNIIKCNRVQPNTTKQHQLRTGTKYYVPPEKSEWPGHSALFRSKINPPQPPQQAPPILSFQIGNDKFIKKMVNLSYCLLDIRKITLSIKNNTEKMVDTINK